jgi:hypothetical protein
MRSFFGFLLVVTGVFALFTLVLFCWNPQTLSDAGFRLWELKANVGQAFGALSAAFVALAFGAALYTVYLQQKQLDLQRKEVEESRSQLLRTTEAQERSVATLRQQALLIAISARLNALTSRMETDLKIIELNMQHDATYGASRGGGSIVLDFQTVRELWNQIKQIEEELKQISERPL